MKVRYIQEVECLKQCNAYYSPEVDGEQEVDHELTDFEMDAFAHRVLQSWLDDPFGSDDNFHRARGVIFDGEDGVATIFRFHWSPASVELIGVVRVKTSVTAV